MMRTIIAGTRHSVSERDFDIAVARCGFEITVVINGGARGVDAMARRWAEGRGIPIEIYPADWKEYGKIAGPRRNQQMAEVADALVALPCNHSRGTHDMIRRAYDLDLLVYTRVTACAHP